MNDIIGALEADHEASMMSAAKKHKNNHGLSTNTGCSKISSKNGSKIGSKSLCAEFESESRNNSRSLVVDIHLPPASEDDEELSAASMQTSLQPQQPATQNRPCKHEVNRFQRCYSDGSQASPKKKAKVCVFLSASIVLLAFWIVIVVAIVIYEKLDNFSICTSFCIAQWETLCSEA